jgi:uncharacterized protein YbcV (DUF1398 family)
MFLAEQITTAHRKVKSGADFPAYIQEVKQLGVTFYETFVRDGHMELHGDNGYQIILPAKYAPLVIADQCKVEQFKADLRAHQLGKSDYITFINSSANLGVEKWAVRMDQMTCTYFDKAGNEILVEKIPEL